MSQLLKQIGIYGYEVVEFEENHRTSQLHVRYEDRPKSCRKCQADGSKLKSKGLYQRSVRHLKAFGRDVRLNVKCRRFQCEACQKSFVQALPGIVGGRRSSEPYRFELYQLHRKGVSGKELAQDSKLGSATVERIYQEFTQRKSAERISLDCPRILGIDEHSDHTGQRFATTF